MWQISYLVQIHNPLSHYVQVQLTLKFEGENNFIPNDLEIFIPSWSPGSYLMREYARHLRCLRVTNTKGAILEVFEKSKSSWVINLNQNKNLIVNYEVYCHEISVRTSYIDQSHAFLHGPTYLMGVIGAQGAPIIEFRFPPTWSKISTSLDAVEGGGRDQFIFKAKNYDELVDSPVEIGCHDTDGFKIGEVSYELAIFGSSFPISNNIKNDVIKICTYINGYMKDIPFKKYTFIIHFLPQTYGGLEHLQSTVLMYDGRKLALKKEYHSFLSLVAHEYFHAWNVKRIRPVELGPFDYQKEAYTSMLWLAEGLTKFMDDFFIYKSGLMSIDDYLDFIKSDINSYYKTPGRKYDSLESSSFGAWIKLYRPHENLNNTTISYYLKGGLVFLCLHVELRKIGKTIDTLVEKLWVSFTNSPDVGLTKESFFKILNDCGYPEEIVDQFEDYIVTTKEINFLKHFEKTGLDIIYEKQKTTLGVDVEFKGDQIFIKNVIEDGAAYKCGLSAQDEILAVNNQRILRSDWNWFQEQLLDNNVYMIQVSRNGYIRNVEVLPTQSITQVATFKITDNNLFKNII